jgi:hypothetical protein
MQIFLKLMLIAVFFLIFYQDYKDRLVYWFLYPTVGILGFCVQLYYFAWQSIIAESLVNLFFISTLLGISFLYAVFISKKKFLNESIGIGDVFLFLAATVLFPIVTFGVLLIASLLFSLTIHAAISYKKETKTTVPLAGYMSLFFAFVYLISLFTTKNILFII